MKIALLQYQATADKKKNIQKALALCHKAIRNRAQLIVLPENFHFRVQQISPQQAVQAAERIPGATTRVFAQLASQKKVFILLGSLLEKRTQKKKPYNTSVLINDQGQISACYRKQHLFKACLNGKIIDEARHCSQGKKLAWAQVGAMRIGLAICYDVRFAKMFTGYRKKRVDLVCVPSCFTYDTGKAHWEVLLRARAIENTIYIAAPNQISSAKDRVRLYGSSLIIDPWGKVIARGSIKRQEILYARLNPDTIKEARRALPGL